MSSTSIQPELWVDDPVAAVSFYETAFEARVVHRVGDEDDIVAQLAIREARFWVALTNPAMGRLSPAALEGATSRALLVVDDPDEVLRRAVGAGARELAAVSDEHGWRLGRIVDPFNHEWEIGRPLDAGRPDAVAE
jgi:PhnB protein